MMNSLVLPDSLLITARGKVIISEACVCHSVHSAGGLCMLSLPVWLPGHVPSGVGLCPWSHVPSGESLSGALCLGVSV